MNKKKQQGTAWRGVVVVLLGTIMAAAEGALPFLVIAVIAAVICIVNAAAKKKSVGAAADRAGAVKRMSAHETSTRAYSAHGGESAAIRCTCSKGKQRYLDQAAMFYKNGFIDRAEYNLMCERYNKLDLPEGL